MALQPSVKATVVIPTKNPGPIFAEVLQATVSQVAPWPFEIIVIDSGSTDGTVELCLENPAVRLLQIPPSEFGHGKTRNFAIRQASGEFVALLTHDALPATPTWLHELVQSVEADESIAGAFGRHLAYPHASALMKRDLKMHFDHFLSWPLVMGIDDPERYAVDQGYRQVLHFFSDNNACLRRSVWETNPYPDVDFAEDQIWAKQVIERGYKRAYCDTAAVFHSHDYSVMETLRRSYDEARAFRRTFGYRLCPSIGYLVYQVMAGTKADLKFLRAQAPGPFDWSLALRTPFAHVARQTGRYLGQRADHRLVSWAYRILSLDNRLKVSKGSRP